MIEVTVTTKTEKFTEQFNSQFDARAFIREELKWESTVRVQCEELNIDERGSFA